MINAQEVKIEKVALNNKYRFFDSNFPLMILTHFNKLLNSLHVRGPWKFAKLFSDSGGICFTNAADCSAIKNFS